MIAEEPKGEGNSGHWVPRPDPTILTTSQLLREIGSLKELIFTRLDAMDRAVALLDLTVNRVPTDTDKQIAHLKSLHETLIAAGQRDLEKTREVVETRIAGMDKAIELLQAITNQIPARVDEKISALKEINQGEFKSIQGQFSERDTRTEQTSRDSKVAVDAALQAAKEAVAEQNRSSALAIAKSEASTDKRIDQIVALVSTATSALDGKITDIKDRLVRIEGERSGISGAQGTQHGSATLGVAITSAVIAGVSLLLAAAALLHVFH
jgi:hypothetical protein